MTHRDDCSLVIRASRFDRLVPVGIGVHHGVGGLVPLSAARVVLFVTDDGLVEEPWLFPLLLTVGRIVS